MEDDLRGCLSICVVVIMLLFSIVAAIIYAKHGLHDECERQHNVYRCEAVYVPVEDE